MEPLKDEERSTWRDRWAGWVRENLHTILLFGTFTLFLLLRLRVLSALPVYDEARFVLFVRSFRSSAPDPFYGSFIFVHPPGYILAGYFAGIMLGKSLAVFRLVSLAFASGSFFVLYRLVKTVYGRNVALFSCLALSLLPASSGVDAWAKEDAICMFFMLCAMLLFLEKHYFWSGVLLGVSILCKENGILLLYVLPVYLVLVKGKKEAWRGLLITAFAAFLACGWWFIFYSDTRGLWLTFYTGSNPGADSWRYPWHYYLSGTVTDLGWVLLPVAVMGAVLAVRSYFKDDDDRGVLPVVIVIVSYVFFSFSAGKPFWMISIALPAWAWLAGIGLDAAYRFLLKKPRGVILAPTLLAVLLILALALNLYLGGDRYVRQRDNLYYQASRGAQETARIINQVASLPEEANLLVVFEDDNPMVIYHLRPGIRHVYLQSALNGKDDVTQVDLVRLWIDEGIDAAWFNLEERSLSVAEIYYEYFEGSLISAPDGYVLVPY